MTSAHSSGSPEFGQESGARKEGLQDARILCQRFRHHIWASLVPWAPVRETTLAKGLKKGFGHFVSSGNRSQNRAADATAGFCLVSSCSFMGWGEAERTCALLSFLGLLIPCV